MPEFVRPPSRVVSLVPSLTQTVFALGAGSRLVGRTRWCVEPGVASSVLAVGGTKDPDIERIRALAPDLVLANREENRKEDVAALTTFTRVLVTYPRSPEEAATMIDELGAALGTETRAAEIAASIRDRLARVRRARPRPPWPRFAYLVWQKPWMAASSDTYIGRLLEEVGLVNVFAGAGSRYPELSVEMLRATAPDLVLLPDEPYRFGPAQRESLRRQGIEGRIELVSGRPFSWFGAETAIGLALAASLRRGLMRPPGGWTLGPGTKPGSA